MSLVSAYAHGRSQLPFSSANLVVTNDGSTTAAHSLYFCLQGENPVGYSLASAIVGPISLPAGSRLVWTLPTTVKGTGEAWTGYCLSASLTNDAASFVQLARVASVDSGGGAISLPYTLTLSTDAQLTVLALTVVSAEGLPAVDALPGMRRGVYNLGFVYEYAPDSDRAIDGLTTLAAVSPSPGRWLRVGAWSNAVSDTTLPGGCAQDIRDINEQVVRYARYGCDGSDGKPMDFWLANTGNAAIASGQRVLITVLLSEIPRSGAFEGALRVTFRGYANTSTGVVRTTNPDGTPFRGLNTPLVFENKKTDLLFDDDLQPGEAYWLSILPNFIPAYFDYGIANHSLIKVFCTLAPQAGAYAPGGGALGDRVYASDERGLVVPAIGAAVTCLKRSGFVNSREFFARGSDGTRVGPLAYNTAGQLIRINGNGEVYLGTGSSLDTEATRAVVDMVAGVSNPSPPSASVFVSAADGQGLSVTLYYPSNGVSATVRADYPDLLLAGTTKAKLNPVFVTLYVTIRGITKAFANRLLVDGATQTFALLDWNAGTVISAIPNAPNSKFCPFEALSATAIAVSGGSNFPLTDPVSESGDYAVVSFAFQYDGTSVSAISHARADGCLYTALVDLSDMESAFGYWGVPVPTFAALPLVSVPLGQVRQVLATGALYRWTGLVWEFAVSPEFWGNPVANTAALPAVADVPIGQVRLLLETGRLYRSTGLAWVLASSGGSGSGSGVLNRWRLG